ncbi:hypothetical protein D9M70_555560 [compost metagenome]
MTKPTDAEILDTMTASGKITAVIAAGAFGYGPPIDTAYVRRRLMAMEKTGQVKRVRGVYARQITWARIEQEPSHG